MSVAVNRLPKPRLIGLVGEAGCGKDTVAGFALDYITAEAFAFADPMKQFAGDVFGFSRKQLYGPSEFRNAVDARLSYDPPHLRVPTKPDLNDVRGFRALMVQLGYQVKRVLRIAAPVEDNRSAPVVLFDRAAVDAERARCWARFEERATPWLQQVLPPGYPLELGLNRLRVWMEDVMAQANITPRYVLQTLGTEWGRAISDSIWVDRGIRTAKELMTQGFTAIIKDVRFLNEAQLIRDNGGEVWYINRPSINREAVQKAGVAGHPSEAQQRSPEMQALVTRVIPNTGTLDDLEGHVLEALADA